MMINSIKRDDINETPAFRPSGDASVMIVHTNSDLLTRMRHVVSNVGFKQIANASHHYQALDRLKERKFQFVFFEAGNTQMSSHEFVRLARNLDPEMIMVAISSEPRVDDVFGLLREGARHYLVPPFNASSVESVLASAMTGPPLSYQVLFAPDRNSALAWAVLNSLDQLAASLCHAKHYRSAQLEIPHKRRQLVEVFEIATTFCEGDIDDLRGKIIDNCIARANTAATRLGRTRIKLKDQRAPGTRLDK